MATTILGTQNCKILTNDTSTTEHAKIKLESYYTGPKNNNNNNNNNL
jgi:hypothetical protein